MATQYHNLSNYDPDLMPEKDIVATQKYAIAVAEWNPDITEALLNGTVNTLIVNGVTTNNITIVHVPGTFELTFAAKRMYEDYTINEKNELSPVYLKKAGILFETKGQAADAEKMYLQIKNDYPKSMEAGDIDKYLARVQK